MASSLSGGECSEASISQIDNLDGTSATDPDQFKEQGREADLV